MTENGHNPQHNTETLIERGYHERLRRAHLIMLCVMTVFYIGISLTGLSLGWETWMLPFFGIGVVVCWGLHIRQTGTERFRTHVFFIEFWMLLVYHGVHASSFWDLVSLAAIEFAVLALTNELRLLNIGFLLFWFCWLWSGSQVIREPGFELAAVDISRTAGNLGVVVTSYIVARTIMRNRVSLRETDERVIEELSDTKRRTEDFLVHVSHAFRTPVNVATGIAAALFAGEEDKEKQKSLRHVAEAGSDLSIKLDDLLDYTELETEQFLAVSEPYMIASVINDVLAALHLYTKEIPLEVVVDVDADLPKVIKGDARRMKKVLFHLLDNALKYTKRGGVYVRIYRESRAYGFNLCIDVRDTGIGMSAEELSDIREGIYRIEGKRHFKSEGFGLGLRIVHGIAHTMNGFVRMESKVNRGTEVHVSIPQEIAEEGRCMELTNAGKLKLVLVRREDQFRVPVVRDYYNNMVMNVIRAFSLNMKRVQTFRDLKTLLEEDETITHVLISEREYEEDPVWFDTLAMLKHVLLIGGLSFETKPGSKVTILRKPFYAFPLVEALNAETAEDAKERLKAEAPARFDGVRALVVDDEEMNLIVAKRVLTDYGMQVALANNGKEAVFLARSNPYDVIFMDHLMPDMDGVSCARRIRDVLLSEGRQVKIIALTANATSGAREMFAKEGFDGFVAKPVGRMDLERELRRVFSKADAVLPAALKDDSVPLKTPEKAGQKTETITPQAEKKTPHTFMPMEAPRNLKTGKRRILVCTDSAADMPEEWVRMLDIRVIHHILHTDTGSFYDNREIDGDELMYYMRDEGHVAKSEVPNRAAFGKFFAECLQDADDVVYISIAKDSSPVYGYAVEAQRYFEHVHIIDSGSMSGGTGLSVLYAAYLTQTGIGLEELLARVKRAKTQIVARFILENTAFLLRGRRMSPFLSRWMDAFLLHPTINMKDEKMKFSVSMSSQHRRTFLYTVLRNKKKIDTSLLFITHAGLSEPELRRLREETERIVHFDRVITMATSGAVAVNVGPGTFGLMFHTLSDDKDTGGRLFDFLPE